MPDSEIIFVTSMPSTSVILSLSLSISVEEVSAYHEFPEPVNALPEESQSDIDNPSNAIGQPSQEELGSSTRACVPLRSG